MSDLTEITDSEFQDSVLNSSLPVMVEFGAVWCHPCKLLEPILLQIMKEKQGKFTLLKMDVDESVEAALRYQVMSVPTLLLFKSGQPVERWVGYQSKDRILSKLTAHID